MLIWKSTSKLWLAVCAAGLLSVSPTLGQAPSATSASPAKMKTQFETVMRNLDQGGDLLVIANMDGAVDDFFESIVMPLVAIAGTGPKQPGAPDPVAIANRIRDYVKTSGLASVEGVGMSTLPLPSGKNQIKFFVGRPASAAAAPAWSMFGTAPGALTTSAYIPSDSVMVHCGHFRAAVLWQMIRQGVGTIGGTEAIAEFNKGLASTKEQQGIDINGMIQSLGDECFISVQLSRTQTMKFPANPGQPPMSIPLPSAVLGYKIKNGMIPKFAVKQFEKPGQQLMRVKEGEVTITSLGPVPDQPFPLQPAWAVHEDVLLVGTTIDAVKSAIRAGSSGKGLTSTLEYRTAMKGMPSKINGFSYVSKRFGKTILEIQEASLKNDPTLDPAARKMVMELMGSQDVMGGAIVRYNMKSGVGYRGVGDFKGRDLVAAGLVGPAGLMAAIAIPSFMKSRVTSQQNSCISNLRQLESAKEQWALENAKANGDVATPQQLGTFLRGGIQQLVCPAGGVITHNPVGVNATCSNPGHALAF